jgi:protein-S-isoprenylcysteine O-methyltransferase Ste14
MEIPKDSNSDKADLNKNIIRRFYQIVATLILTALILFISSGRMDWIWAWIYLAMYVLLVIVNAIIFKPEMIAERGRKKENVEKWDKLINLFGFIPWIGLYAVSGLDIRFGWTQETTLWNHLTGVIIFVPGVAMVSWAMVSNTWFSTAVRIQYDRDHSVADSGPYRYIRHPGYLGMIVYTLGMPLIFGSLWAFIPVILMIIIVIIRTRLEDNTLKTKLKGYKEYAERVKFRLLPLIW